MLQTPGESKGQQQEGEGGTDRGGKSSLEIKLLITVNGTGPQGLYTASSPWMLAGTSGQSALIKGLEETEGKVGSMGQ